VSRPLTLSSQGVREVEEGRERRSRWRGGGVRTKLRRGVQPVRYLSPNARMISRRRRN